MYYSLCMFNLHVHMCVDINNNITRSLLLAFHKYNFYLI